VCLVQETEKLRGKVTLPAGFLLAHVNQKNERRKKPTVLTEDRKAFLSRKKESEARGIGISIHETGPSLQHCKKT